MSLASTGAATTSSSSSSPYPSKLSDIQLGNSSFQQQPTLYQTLKTLRKTTLSLHNRLASIHADAIFVQSVAVHYNHDGRGLAVIANERCGSWYVSPRANSGGSAYFKSTDGHYGQWTFSQRRLNLQVLEVLGRCGGAILVDSTRRGKDVPDALARTVPVWVAVLNRACFPERRRRRSGSSEKEGCWWGGRLQVWNGRQGGGGGGGGGKEGWVGESERLQIESRLDEWVQGFLALGVDVKKLREVLGLPIRIKWAVNGWENFDDDDDDDDDDDNDEDDEWDIVDEVEDEDDENGNENHMDCRLLVLCSASRRVRGTEASGGGYIQGAGDDAESWACGLTPQLFWDNKDLLLAQTSDDVLKEIITSLVNDSTRTSATQREGPVLITPTKNIYLSAMAPGMLEVIKGDNAGLLHDKLNGLDFDLVIHCNEKSSSGSARVLDLECRTGKLGSRDLREKLALAKSFICTTVERNPSFRILITCSTGKDLAVGVAVTFLCLFFDDAGRIRESMGPPQIDKTLVKQRLAWISNVKPEANPSRSTLQSVNAFLMDRP